MGRYGFPNRCIGYYRWVDTNGGRMNTWAELMDQAMLGTQGTSAPIGEWASYPPEQVLLKQIALVGAARRAGLVIEMVRSMPVIDPAPPESLLPCSAYAMDWLKKLDRTSY